MQLKNVENSHSNYCEMLTLLTHFSMKLISFDETNIFHSYTLHTDTYLLHKQLISNTIGPRILFRYLDVQEAVRICF